MVPDYYDMASSSRSSEEELGALRQVAVDVPRTAPGVPFFHEPRLQKSLERILYIWGIRWLHLRRNLGTSRLPYYPSEWSLQAGRI